MSIVPPRAIYQKPEKCTKSAAAHRRHVDAVKSLPCVICQAPPPSDAHHFQHGRYGTSRPCDCNTMPMCRKCHREYHDGKHTWAKKHGNDYDYLPQVLAMIECNS